MALAPGVRLGPYEITAQIGVGGMGEVYQASRIMGAVGRGRGRRTGLALTFRRPLMFPSDSRSRTSSRSTADRSGVWATARTFAPNVHRPLMSCPNLTRGGLQP